MTTSEQQAVPVAREMRAKLARAIEIAIVERTMRHPVAKFWKRLHWLWPLVADAVFASLPCKSGEGAGDREAIARIIDPYVWEDGDDTHGAYMAQRIALEKADEILALRESSNA